MDNSVTENQSVSSCDTCPSGAEEEQLHSQTLEGESSKSWIYSSGIWTPASEYENFTQDRNNGNLHATSYFDYYSGIHGYDPTSSEWEDSSLNRILAEPGKLQNLLAFQSAYNNDVVDNLLYNYAYGNGADYEMSEEEFKDGLGIAQTLSVTSFPDVNNDINNLSPNESVEISSSREVYAANAGTAGHYSVSINGTLSKDEYGLYVFNGTLSFSDNYNFDASDHRLESDENKVTIARRYLWGKPFEMKGEYQVTEHQYIDKALSIYNGMNRKNIVPNTCFKNDKHNE